MPLPARRAHADSVAMTVIATEEAMTMPKYVIERTVPEAGGLSSDELHRMSAASNAVLQDLDGDVQWVQTYVAEDRLFCVYNAENEQLIHEHARRGGFPCDRVREVRAVIDPVTGES